MIMCLKVLNMKNINESVNKRDKLLSLLQNYGKFIPYVIATKFDLIGFSVSIY